MRKSVTVKAFAKVNMYLEIGGLRENGYHDVATLYRGVGLYDELAITAEEEETIRLTVSATDAVDMANVPTSRENLAWQAADMLRRSYPDRVGGMGIALQKRIPAESGLAGGSADAAAALLGVDRLYGLALDSKALHGFAAQLGADVPFCLSPLAAIGRGRGETLTSVGPLAPLWIVLVKPPFGMGTKAVYGTLDKMRADGFATGGAANLPQGDLDDLLQSLRDQDLPRVWQYLRNDLQTPAMSIESSLASYMARIGQAASGLGCGGPMLSGSGSAIAVYSPDERTACLLEERLQGAFGMDRPLIMHTKTLTEADLADRILWTADGAAGPMG